MTNEVDAEDWGAWARSRIRNAGDNREHVKGMAQLADRLDEAVRLLSHPSRCAYCTDGFGRQCGPTAEHPERETCWMHQVMDFLAKVRP